MSNKIVPQIYRAVIEDVMNGIKPEFEEYGVGDDVFRELQTKWEKKVLESRVAEFEQTPQQPAQPQQHHPYPHILMPPGAHPHYAHYAAAPPGSVQVKTESGDQRYMLGATSQYTLPALPGPQLNGVAVGRPPQYGGQTSVISFPPGPPPTLQSNGATAANGAANSTSPQPVASSASPPAPAAATAAPSNGGSGGRIPQLDGPSDDSDDSPSPPSYAPRSKHPSLPQPQSQSQGTSASAGDEAINSDLDDSDEGDDEEAEEGTSQDADIVFCTYDKVARVKNKWKCILKDGMIHVNGKDYLFSKCTGEFEW
ncbi:general rna polymerase ii transcription factor [Moniliophthora roreri MCA 2997]|uniref:Transcription initiation factor IIA large subunit n=1 Tax=Moniliophthora roreri (strain MCA 2997) TaxID=1381753 RepID=V2YHU3_MONRO|nr:general rna polymerase ii transcription factor [Moniliophthora roreri MCA 2997]